MAANSALLAHSCVINIPLLLLSEALQWWVLTALSCNHLSVYDDTTTCLGIHGSKAMEQRIFHLERSLTCWQTKHIHTPCSYCTNEAYTEYFLLTTRSRNSMTFMGQSKSAPSFIECLNSWGELSLLERLTNSKTISMLEDPELNFLW